MLANSYLCRKASALIRWFKKIQDKNWYKFVILDIKEFYSSIKEVGSEEQYNSQVRLWTLYKKTSKGSIQGKIFYILVDYLVAKRKETILIF